MKRKNVLKIGDSMEQSKNKRPLCDYCLDLAPYGDERNLWLDYHLSWYHKLYWTIRNKLKHNR